MAKPVRPNPELINRVRVLVAETSVPKASRLLRLAEATVARVAGGLPVSEGTVALISQRLSEETR